MTWAYVYTNQLKKILPVVLCHQTEESQEGPAKRVVVCVAIVGIVSSLKADVPIRANTVHKMKGEASNVISDRHGKGLEFLVPQEKDSSQCENKMRHSPSI